MRVDGEERLLIDVIDEEEDVASSGHLPRGVLVKALSAILSVLRAVVTDSDHNRSRFFFLTLSIDDSYRDDRRRMKVIELDFPEKDLTYIGFKELPSEGGETIILTFGGIGGSKSHLEEDPPVSPFLDDILR